MYLKDVTLPFTTHENSLLYTQRSMLLKVWDFFSLLGKYFLYEIL